MNILVINSGSSSIKYKLFEMPEERLLSSGIIEHIGEKGSEIKDHYQGLKIILGKVRDVSCIGHRVVHGAEKFRKPVIVNNKVIRDIRACCSLAPLHNPANLAGILACKKLMPRIPQVAVFDTAFYQTLKDYVYIYGLPYEYYKSLHVRKYGFHGTSHEYVARQAAHILKKPFNKLKIITCHLGNGCSITATDCGKSVDTSMGFTPLEGLVMGTRCGDVDTAAVLYIMRKRKIDLNQMDNILNKKSGLLGISGISNDMRLIDKAASLNNKRAKLAIQIFAYRIKKYIGAYTAVMGGVDALIFTAGIGEHQKNIRRAVTKGLFSYLKKKPRVLVIPTNEELMIARQAYLLVTSKHNLKARY
ncbi:MAG: acetate kinase [Candidatus Omnitrophica bacterium]|nr:acetate kinase [Candidatus Omnitrophota bacterium]